MACEVILQEMKLACTYFVGGEKLQRVGNGVALAIGSGGIRSRADETSLTQRMQHIIKPLSFLAPQQRCHWLGPRSVC
jgi:hypothetical protein